MRPPRPPRLPRRAATPALRSLALLAAGVLVATATVAPGAQAALNGPRSYDADYGYLPGLGGSEFTMASGRLEAVIPDGDGSWGFFATGGATVSGLTRVCWTSGTRQCSDSSSGGLSVVVLPGGSFGLELPAGADARLEARHAVAMFVDLSGTGDLNSLELGRSLLAPLVAGEVVLSNIPEIPASALFDPVSRSGGAVVATEASTRIEVREGAILRATLNGKGDPVTFTGSPSLTPIATELAVLPFEGSGAVARFVAAERADAEVGLDIPRINRLMGRLYSANAGSATQAAGLDETAFGTFKGATAALFAGAVLSLPSANDGRGAGQALAFARTPTLEVRGLPDARLAWSGKAVLDVHDGHVEGAQRLYGPGFLALPWWGWLLWVAALTVWIVRLVRKPEKKNARWDPYKWVGWVASAIVFLLVFWLWDLEMRAVLGLSLFGGGLSGQILLLVALLQVATLGLLSFAAIAPLRLLLRNGSLLLHQGTFMGLAGAVAGLLGFLIGATLLRSGLDLVFSQILASIG
ncbi:MAG TPA: hypothetical protein VM327_04445 [Candidatus Thermoplasmatota archaeon]|nr:hypothetical protein [Candidatus Thermoplasmatota archaeon]